MNHRIIRLLSLVLVSSCLFLSACQPIQMDQSPTSTGPITLTVATHDSFSVSEEVITQFELDNNIRLQFLTLGDAGEALNKIILSKDAPLADVFYGVDNTFLSRALAADVFIPYDSSMLAEIPDELELDSEHRLLPVDFGYVNINVDSAWFTENDIAPPTELVDLTKPEYRDLLVIMNPATSSPGLAFLLTTAARFGPDNYLDFWADLKENGVLITDGWSEAYFEHFTVGSGGAGDRPLVVSYSTSPPADVVYATDGRTVPASVNLSPPGETFRQIEFVGILAGTEHLTAAQTFVDFMLSQPFQEDIPLQMFVYPANQNAALPDIFVQYGQTPEEPASISYEQIEENRQKWIEEWTAMMLR